MSDKSKPDLPTPREAVTRCPTCDSPAPHLHPAVQHEGEVQVCRDAFHDRATPEQPRGRVNPYDLETVHRGGNITKRGTR